MPPLSLLTLTLGGEHSAIRLNNADPPRKEHAESYCSHPKRVTDSSSVTLFRTHSIIFHPFFFHPFRPTITPKLYPPQPVLRCLSPPHTYLSTPLHAPLHSLVRASPPNYAYLVTHLRLRRHTLIRASPPNYAYLVTYLRLRRYTLMRASPPNYAYLVTHQAHVSTPLCVLRCSVQRRFSILCT